MAYGCRVDDYGSGRSTSFLTFLALAFIVCEKSFLILDYRVKERTKRERDEDKQTNVEIDRIASEQQMGRENEQQS